MQKIALRGASVPSDFQYFRSISPSYRTYLEQCGIKTVDIGQQFGWIKDFKLFQIVKFERTELPPTRELLASVGFKRGVVLWIPAHVDAVTKPWREMMIPGGHFTLTGIGRATTQYWMQWNERARRARKRFLEQDEVEIVAVTKQEFVDAFSATRVKHAFRSDYIRYFTKMSDINENTVRSFLAISKKLGPLAGLAVHDSYNMSTHLVAFTSREAKVSQCGTGLIDTWYRTSLNQDIKYIHFDHLRDVHMTADQQGYTNFKLNFIEDLIEYPKCYFQFWGSSL